MRTALPTPEPVRTLPVVKRFATAKHGGWEAAVCSGEVRACLQKEQLLGPARWGLSAPSPSQSHREGGSIPASEQKRDRGRVLGGSFPILILTLNVN